MEKIKLNNQVILMRKFVKQAKVHCINKLVKEVKLLQNRKGNEVKVLKAKRKAEKFLEEISLIKKMKVDLISKLALSKAKNWKDVLLTKNCPIEDRCIAMLANYEPVQKEVENFLHSNKDIASRVANLFSEWDEKNKLNKYSVQKKKSSIGKIRNNTITQNKNSKETEEKLYDKNHESDVYREVSSIKKNQACLPVHNSNHNLKKNMSAVKKEKKKKPEFVNHNLEQCGEMDLEDKPKVSMNDVNWENENKYVRDNQFKLNEDCDAKGISESKNDFVMQDNESGSGECDSDNVIENDFEVCNVETKKGLHSGRNNLLSKKFAKSDFKNSHSLKVDNSIRLNYENKVKTIAMLNLDDLKDLIEFPVEDNINNDKSCEENLTDEGSTDNESSNDPFFLGRDEAVSVENKLIDDPNSRKYKSVDKIFDRKEKSFDPSSFENKSHRPMNRSQLRQSLRAETLSNDNIFCKNDQKVQNRNKSSFEKTNIKGRFQPYNKYKNEKNLKRICLPNQNLYKKSNNVYQWNDMKNSPSKNKDYLKKDADSKPLHPSWEAKRKQKTSINTLFQGKRMVFED